MGKATMRPVSRGRTEPNVGGILRDKHPAFPPCLSSIPKTPNLPAGSVGVSTNCSITPSPLVLTMPEQGYGTW
jgi:hypothetical protein